MRAVYVKPTEIIEMEGPDLCFWHDWLEGKKSDYMVDFERKFASRVKKMVQAAKKKKHSQVRAGLKLDSTRLPDTKDAAQKLVQKLLDGNRILGNQTEKFFWSLDFDKYYLDRVGVRQKSCFLVMVIWV